MGDSSAALQLVRTIFFEKEGISVLTSSFMHADPDIFHSHELSLHDCTADRISFTEGSLCFDLPDGLWVTPCHPENPYGKTVRTNAAEVQFSVKDINDILVDVFTGYTWLGSKRTRVDTWTMAQLMTAINSGKCTLEFLTQYRSYYEQLWHCVIHSDRKPYYRDCHIYLPQTQAVFCWNTLCPDREW